MSVQPMYHWQFNEQGGAIIQDSINGTTATLVGATLKEYGRIGKAIRLSGNSSHINFGNVVGQFGTSDFTVAFGMKVLDTHNDNDLDIIGNRTASDHRNVFSVQLREKAKLFFQVDEDESGTNFIEVATPALSLGSDKKWHHIAFVRENITLKIYVDGVLVAQNSLLIEVDIDPIPVTSASSNLTTSTSTATTALSNGPANINNGKDLRLGDWTKGAAVAEYEDLRIYHTALNDLQIENLVTSYTRILRPGYVELIGPDDAAIILSGDVADLSSFSNEGFKVRFGPDTGINLYGGTNFGGATHKFYSDIPIVKPGGSFPKSIRVWSSLGEPFTGKWIIQAPDGQFLSWNGTFLTTSPNISAKEHFILSYNSRTQQPQFIPINDTTGRLFPFTLLVNQPDTRQGAFSFVNMSRDQWLMLNPDKTFSWTSEHSKRAIFATVVKLADNEGQVGEIVEGEVAFYEHSSYVGRVWVLSDGSPLTLGSYPNFTIIPGLNDVLSSVRLGLNTGATLFDRLNNEVLNPAKELEDITQNISDMGTGQIGHDKVSGAKIFRTVASTTIFNSFTSKLSEDYRLINDKLEQFSAYRTILRFAAGISEVEVSATDLTTIVVEGNSFEIDEVRSVTLRPNELNQIMITSEADGITTPGLKFRTRDMVANERVVIFPDQEVHKQLAALAPDALWNASDAQGNPIVDQTVHTQSEIATVQSTIKRVMSTVVYTDNDVKIATASPNGLGTSQLLSAMSLTESVAGATVGNPWELHLTFSTSSTGGAVVTGDPIREVTISQSAFEQLLAQTTTSTANVLSARSLSARSIFSDIKDAVKQATSVVIGFANNALQTIIRIGNNVINFVLDTAAKVATFVEAVVARVVKTIKQFIEFLRFLFDWDDILHTQKFLVSSINSAFDYATDLVDSAKAPVAEFIDTLQEEIEDGINGLIRRLGGDPEADEESPGLPEAAEWFLNLLLGESRNSDNDATIANKAASDTSVGDSLQDAFGHLLEALRDAIGIAAELQDGLIDTIEAFIKNPLHPELALIEILETLRNVGIQALDLGEEVIFAFLDLVIVVIKLFKEMLNVEIRLPLISRLFELIGAGKLTPLNVFGLLVAIPTTILHKLIFGEAPFRDVLPPVLVNQENGARSTLASLQTRGLNETLSANEKEHIKRLIRGFGGLALLADLINGVITAGLDAFPEKADGFGIPTVFWEIGSLLLSWVSWFGSFPASGSPSEPGGYPYALHKHKVTKADNETEYRQRVVWGWRTAILGLDTMYMIMAIKKGNPEQMPLQRLRRAEKNTIMVATGATLIDLGLTGLYLTTLSNGQAKNLEGANEVIALLPPLACGIRLSVPKGAIALGLLDLVATITTFGLGWKLLKDAVADVGG